MLTEIASGLMTPPVNIGPKSTPNYEALAADAIAEVGDGITVFAGQRDDPFWVDLGGIGDLLTIRQLPGNAGGGVDDLAGLNVQALAIQVPIEQLTSDGAAPADAEAANAVIGVWTTALRPSTTVFGPGTQTASGNHVQISRLGMPLVNEVVAPLGAKDLFNSSHPGNDAQFLGAVTDPELAKLLNLLYGDGAGRRARIGPRRPGAGLPDRRAGTQPAGERHPQRDAAAQRRHPAGGDGEPARRHRR